MHTRERWRRGLRLNKTQRLHLCCARARARREGHREFARRLKAILLVGHEHLTQESVASIFDVTPNCITRWVMTYSTIGLEGLRPVKPPGAAPRLSAKQKMRLARMIDWGPERCGLDTGVWTGPIVQDLIKRKFGVDYSVRQVRSILREIGFTMQYPKHVLSEASQLEQERWLRRRFPEIRRRAESEGGVILFQDECIFQQSGTICRTWARRGVGTEVRSKPVRRGCKVYGAVSVNGKTPKFHFRFEKGKFNAYGFITFLEGVVRYYSARRQKVHMIVDGAKYHRTAVAWANNRSDQIELHFLPPYSPNLNAAEQLWRLAKRESTHNRYFPTLESLHKAILRRVNRWQRNPKALRGLVERWL